MKEIWLGPLSAMKLLKKYSCSGKTWELQIYQQLSRGGAPQSTEKTRKWQKNPLKG
jgi:hypothetical protein